MDPFSIIIYNGTDAQELTRKDHKYEYDNNGNLIYINTERPKKDGTQTPKATERKLLWDEKNRLEAIDDNGFVSNYWYDAAGERTVKTSGEGEEIYVNSLFSDGSTQTADFTAYVNPYIVVSKGGQYTKHIYIGSQRIVSKLGDLDSYGSDPRRIEYAGSNVDGAKVDYKSKYGALQQTIKDRYAAFEVPYYGKDNDDYVNGQGFCCDDTPKTKSFAANANDNPELFQYYYHSDHLGSSSLITNLDGEVVQHIEYVPFGEVFIEERNNTWNTPYLFNAKELDEETGLYYYGARYYDPRTSIFISVDQLVEQTGTPYQYCYQNPVKYIDPNGMAPDGGGDGGGRILPRTEFKQHGGSWYRNVGVFAYNSLASFTNIPYDIGESLIQESKFIYNNGVGAYLGNNASAVSNGVSSTYNYLASNSGSQILSNEWNGFKNTMTDPYAWANAVGSSAWMFTPVKAVGSGGKALAPTIKTPAINVGPPASSIAVKTSNSLVHLGEETLRQGAFNGVKIVAGYEVWGTKGLVGNTFNMNIFYLENTGLGTNMVRFLRTMENEAISAGASKISIYGSSVINPRLLNNGAVSRLGYTYEEIGQSVILQKTLK
ncbi:MAG: RHS repeat domain-containing protein [Dysgonomonas sp.]